MTQNTTALYASLETEADAISRDISTIEDLLSYMELGDEEFIHLVCQQNHACAKLRTIHQEQDLLLYGEEAYADLASVPAYCQCFTDQKCERENNNQQRASSLSLIIALLRRVLDALSQHHIFTVRTHIEVTMVKGGFPGSEHTAIYDSHEQLPCNLEAMRHTLFSDPGFSGLELTSGSTQWIVRPL